MPDMGTGTPPPNTLWEVSPWCTFPAPGHEIERSHSHTGLSQNGGPIFGMAFKGSHKEAMPFGYESKMRTQNGTLVNGTKD